MLIVKKRQIQLQPKNLFAAISSAAATKDLCFITAYALFDINFMNPGERGKFSLKASLNKTKEAPRTKNFKSIVFRFCKCSQSRNG